MTTAAFFPFVGHFYAKPLYIDKALGCYVFDESGRRFLDAYSGVATVSVGHSHPCVTKSVIDQALRVSHTTLLYRTRILDTYLDALASCFPAHLNRFFPVNSGSEAVDFACQVARAHRGRPLIAALATGYHGGSFLTKSVTGIPAWRPVFGGDPDVVFAEVRPCRTCSESGWNADAKMVSGLSAILSAKPSASCSGSCLDPLAAIFKLRGSDIAGLVLEPIPGVGGILTRCAGFFEQLGNLRKQWEFDLICDEVQTGFGRLGKTMFGFQRFGLAPDLVCLGKAIANGFPLGMIVGTEEASKEMGKKLHFSTFGGNPVSCAAANATLQVIKEEKLLDNAEVVGETLLDELRRRLAASPTCIEIRGLGLMVGVELADSASASTALDKCFERGLLIGLGGPNRNVLRIQPPLCFTREMAAETARILSESVPTENLKSV